jgi:hypothetical protein
MHGIGIWMAATFELRLSVSRPATLGDLNGAVCRHWSQLRREGSMPSLLQCAAGPEQPTKLSRALSKVLGSGALVQTMKMHRISN